MAENCSVLDTWACRSVSAWISEASARENEAVTRALQISLSDTASSSSSSSSAAAAASPSVATSSSSSSPFLLRHHQHHLALPSPAAVAPLRPLGLTPTGRVSKRRSRPSKRSPTTYINADPENFREMVQRVTGIQIDGRKLDAEPVVESEPARPAAGDCATLKQVCLPTLDSSALLLDSVAVRPDDDRGPFGPPDQVPACDFDALWQIFPNFESWDVI